MSLGVVVATETSPTPNIFHFVISEENARSVAENGTFVQIRNKDNSLTLGMIQTLRRTNRYFSSTDVIHGSSSGLAPPQLFPAEKWDYIIAETKVLGVYKEGLQQRSTKPVLPGSEVDLTDPKILERFLGLDPSGLHIGSLKQMQVPARIGIDRLLQKHLAILSISGGGKSYTTSVIIEELLRRRPEEGRPALVMFDVHGEFGGLEAINSNPKFRNAKVKVIDATSLKLATAYLKSSDFMALQPTMSPAQARELSRAISLQKRANKPLTIGSLKQQVGAMEMNNLVQEALLGWLGVLENLGFFSYYEDPDLETTLEPGTLLILDLSSIISLWSKQVVVYYFLKRIFELRRERRIPPTVTFIEEAHQFCPETTVSPTKKIIETIAREGRKFLCSLVLISQRPVNLSTTALSQCNSHLIMRILNPHDLNYIAKTSEGITKETLDTITSLGVGEGLLTGNAVNYPIFVQIRKKLTSASFDEISLARESLRYEKLYSEME
ncbi:MAG: ATP-binding protein [Methanobacteriota archaeon]|nr:MAG: ATP-binding protein [Euryarchaeota archaeon]